MSIIRPNKRSVVVATRRGVLLGVTASLLFAPAIARAGSIMPVRRGLIAQAERRHAGFVERLCFDSYASGLVHGRFTETGDGRDPTLSVAEHMVRYALEYGFLSRQREDEVRLFFADG